jgi:hypothetical protein
MLGTRIANGVSWVGKHLAIRSQRRGDLSDYTADLDEALKLVFVGSVG